MEPLLRVEKLYKRFGTLEVIRGVSFEVYPNEIVGLAGLSGSGKSVIAQLLAGTFPANSGCDLLRRAAPAAELQSQ